jgi:hypothetical protein
MADCATAFTLNCVNAGMNPGDLAGGAAVGTGAGVPVIPGVGPGDVIPNTGGGAPAGLPVRPRVSSY